MRIPTVVSKVAPVAFLFIGLINYWYLCSYYALIQNVVKPQVLTDLLDIIFRSTNVSFFDYVDINIDVPTGLNNYFDGTFFSKY
jgi:hypothetical protein